MTEQGNFARRAVAFSSLVVAICAVVVTITVISAGISVNQQRVLDPAAVERQVAFEVGGAKQEGTVHVDCPVSVVVEKDNRFECKVSTGVTSKTVKVTIIDDQGELSISQA
jgi:hypothetical protein